MRNVIKSSLLLSRFAFLGAAVSLIMLTSPANAQMADQAELREINSRNAVSIPAAASPFSLLDLSKIQWSNSYSLSYGSGSAGSGSYGMFTTSMLYEFSPSLSMALAVGVGHNPSSIFNNEANSSADLFPAFSLDYHPNNKFHLNLTVVRAPYSPYQSNQFNQYGLYGHQPAGAFSNSLFGSPSIFQRR